MARGGRGHGIARNAIGDRQVEPGLPEGQLNPGVAGTVARRVGKGLLQDPVRGLIGGRREFGLLALSSDVALRKLRARPWKRLQRLNYALFALVVAHAVFYGALSRTTSPFSLLLGLIVVAVFGAQVVGIWLWQRKTSRAASPA
jgi:hypothetical protein